MSGPYLSIHPSIHSDTQVHPSVHNTWELRGLLFAPGERREAQEAGEANLDGLLSPGPTLFPELPGWAAAAGWKKSAGRWKTGENSPPPPLQPPPSPSEKKRYHFQYNNVHANVHNFVICQVSRHLTLSYRANRASMQDYCISLEEFCLKRVNIFVVCLKVETWASLFSVSTCCH